jgi:hypothetical protein
MTLTRSWAGTAEEEIFEEQEDGGLLGSGGFSGAQSRRTVATMCVRWCTISMTTNSCFFPLVRL